jgi:hypothetical protein
MLKQLIPVFGLLWLAMVNSYSESATNTNAGPVFHFKFELNKPLIYDYDFKSRTVTDASAGTRESLTSKTVETHYKMRLTATNTNQDGTTTVFYEPFDFTEDLDTEGPSGHTTTSVRGVDLLCKENDVVVVDTKNGVGMGVAQNLKLPVYIYLLSGYFFFDSAGNIKGTVGDLPFSDTWQLKLASDVGFFNIVFPTNSIDTRDCWTNSISIKSVSGTTYDGDGIIQPHVFVRELDSVVNDTPVACFSLYASGNYQNLGAHADQSGQQTTLDFPELNESMNGTFHFDQKLGRLIDMKVTSISQDTMNFMVQGNPANSRENKEFEISMQLVSP